MNKMQLIKVVVLLISVSNLVNCQNGTQVQGRSAFAGWLQWRACVEGEGCSWVRRHSCTNSPVPHVACGTTPWKEETMGCDRCIGTGDHLWLPVNTWTKCYGTGCSDTMQSQESRCWNLDSQPNCRRKLTKFCRSNAVCDGQWTEWRIPAGTSCSAVCGGGIVANLRQCFKNGRESGNCDLSATFQFGLIETRVAACNLFDCRATRYSEWGACLCTSGVARRSRQCVANCNTGAKLSEACVNPACQPSTTTSTTMSTTQPPTTRTTTPTTTIVTESTTTTPTTTTTTTTTTAKDYGRINIVIPQPTQNSTIPELETNERNEPFEPTLKSWTDKIIIIAVSALVVGFLISIALFLLCCRRKLRRKRVVYIAGDRTAEVAEYNTLDRQDVGQVQLYESMSSLPNPSFRTRPLPQTPDNIAEALSRAGSTHVTPSTESSIRPPKPPRRNRPSSKLDNGFDSLTLPPGTPQFASSAPVSPNLSLNSVKYSSLRKISANSNPYLAPMN